MSCQPHRVISEWVKWVTSISTKCVQCTSTYEMLSICDKWSWRQTLRTLQQSGGRFKFSVLSLCQTKNCKETLLHWRLCMSAQLTTDSELQQLHFFFFPLWERCCDPLYRMLHRHKPQCPHHTRRWACGDSMRGKKLVNGSLVNEF